MEFLTPFLEAIPSFLKAKAASWLMTSIVVIASVAINKDKISDFFFEKDNPVEEYVKKSFVVERDLNFIRHRYKAQVATICLFHNGTMSIDESLHLMKYTLLFGSSDSRNEIIKDKMLYRSVSLAPWSNKVYSLIQQGYFLMPDVELSEDPLEHDLFKSTGRHTFLYIPLYNKETLMGFLCLAYKNVTPLSMKEISKIQRSVEPIEAHLLSK